MIDRGPVVRLCAMLAVALVAWLVALQHLVVPWAVAGRSMEPVLRNGDRVLVDRWTYGRRTPHPGEIVLLEGPGGVAMVKRIVPPPASVALEGDAFWVVGDNAADSRDSRQFGVVRRESILGRVVLRYWPPGRAGTPG